MRRKSDRAAVPGPWNEGVCTRMRRSRELDTRFDRSQLYGIELLYPCLECFAATLIHRSSALLLSGLDPWPRARSRGASGA